MNRATTHGGPDSPPKVLLVEDHPIVRQGCREMLEDAGFDVVWDGGESGEGYRQFVALAPDVVVLDLSVEGASGLETIRRLRHHSPNARIVVFSMHDDATIASRALKSGALAYVTKTSAPDELASAVHSVLAGKPFLSHDIAHVLALSRLPLDDNPLAGLSDRELEVFRLVVEGHNSTQIADILSVSTKAASNYIGRLKTKLGARSVADLVRISISCGFSKRNVDP